MKKYTALHYFRIAFTKWFNKQDLTQKDAALRIGISTSLLNGFRSGKNGISFENAELICNFIGKPLEEMIKNGKFYCGEDELTKGLTEKEIDAVEAFITVLKCNDTAAKMIVKNTLDFAADHKQLDTQNSQRDLCKSA